MVLERGVASGHELDVMLDVHQDEQDHRSDDLAGPLGEGEPQHPDADLRDRGAADQPPHLLLVVASWNALGAGNGPVASLARDQRSGHHGLQQQARAEAEQPPPLVAGLVQSQPEVCGGRLGDGDGHNGDEPFPCTDFHTGVPPVED